LEGRNRSAEVDPESDLERLVIAAASAPITIAEVRTGRVVRMDPSKP
jgi:hypothetical protein